MANFKIWLRRVGHYFWKNKIYALGLMLVALWCLPYFGLFNRMEWGDFSFLAQAYEAMRVQIVNYHQFPWWNPWESGGVPLYGDPQMGLFSIQMLLTFVVGAPTAMVLTVVLFTFLGYGSMLLLLRRYFKIKPIFAVLLSVLWILSSFFAAHLPSHFTFIWYLLAPFYVYLALTVRSWRGGVLMGVTFAVMALSALHNAFFHILLICGIIVEVRLIIESKNRWRLLGASALAGFVYVLLAGHRMLYAMQYVRGVHHDTIDPPVKVLASISGLILPFSRIHHFTFVKYPQGPYGFGEMTGTIGTFANLAALVAFIFMIWQILKRRENLKKWLWPLVALIFAVSAFLLALGKFFRFAPYAFLKHLPVYGSMRVPSRWYLWLDFGLLIFIGLVANQLINRPRLKRALVILLALGIAEMFWLNWGYQKTILAHQILKPQKNITELQFIQTNRFGEVRALPTGDIIPNDGNLPRAFGEYEATLYNTGVIEANNALVDLFTTPGTHRCSYAAGCGLVLSNNAQVTYWSPGYITLQRTAPGPIKLNINDSNYLVVNGQRRLAGIAEPFRDFVLDLPDQTTDITIAVKAPPFKHKIF